MNRLALLLLKAKAVAQNKTVMYISEIDVTGLGRQGYVGTVKDLAGKHSLIESFFWYRERQDRTLEWDVSQPIIISEG